MSTDHRGMTNKEMKIGVEHKPNKNLYLAQLFEENPTRPSISIGVTLVSFDLKHNTNCLGS